jgi:hypothetical protein
MLMFALADFASDDGGDVFPSKYRLAKLLRITERSVKRMLAGLVAEGWLIALNSDAGGSSDNVRRYRINIARLRAMPVIAKPANWEKFIRTSDAGVTGDAGDTGDTHVTGGVTPVSKRGDTSVTQIINKQSINNQGGCLAANNGSKPPSCPHQKIIDLYHETLPTLPRVSSWTTKRRQYLNARWREDPKRQNLEWWRGFFKYVAKSDLLTGNLDGRPWQANLEWLVKESNFVKVIEGNYENRSAA